MYKGLVTIAMLISLCRADTLHITKAPAVEVADDRSVILTWTTNTGGDSIVHYGITAANLNQTATSPNRWNKNLPAMVHRVLIADLRPATRYYYVVETGPTKSPVAQFVTRPEVSH